MREITTNILKYVKGGMIIDGMRESSNVIDQRGTDNGIYTDANGSCWIPGTSSNIMYPSGGGPSYGRGGNSASSSANSGS